MPDTTVHFECHPTVEQAGQSAIDLLAAHCALSRQKIKQAMQNGALWLQRGKQVRRLRRAKKALKAGDSLHFYYDANIQRQHVAPAKLVADEGQYSIWHKPYGMYSQGSRWGDHCTLYRFAEQQLRPERPAFIVHRLDRAASGLMILAHSKKTAAAFARLFQRHEIRKQYMAEVAANLTALALPLEINHPIDGKAACSRIVAVEKMRSGSRLRIEIETGRKHQIRRHLAEQGWPIIGDRLYGPEPADKNLQLKSVYLAFTCPVTGEKKVFKLSTSNIQTETENPKTS